MGILMDIFIVTILLINIFIGYKKGLINAAVSICAFLIAIIATLILFKPVSNFIIDNTYIDEKIKETIINNIEDNSQENTNESTGIQGYIQAKIANTADEAKDKAIEETADIISIKSIEIITAIILYIIVRIVVIFLKCVTGAVSKIPIIKQFNEAGGIIYGLIRALIIIYIFIVILLLVSSINKNGIIVNAIDQSYITKYLYYLQLSFY